MRYRSHYVRRLVLQSGTRNTARPRIPASVSRDMPVNSPAFAKHSHHPTDRGWAGSGNIFDPPPNSPWSYRVSSSAPTADRLSVWLVRRSGILCRTACGIRLLAGTVSDNLRRRFCSQRTDAFSTLEVSRRCAI